MAAVKIKLSAVFTTLQILHLLFIEAMVSMNDGGKVPQAYPVFYSSAMDSRYGACFCGIFVISNA